MKTDTPETDAVWYGSVKVDSVDAECMLRKHAEKLERERDALLVALEDLVEHGLSVETLKSAKTVVEAIAKAKGS